MSTVSVTKLSISADAAKLALDAAAAEAAKLGLAASIAILDESGTLKAFLRMDGSLLSGIQVAQDKAYSSVATQLPTSAWLGVTSASKEFELGLFGIDRICPISGGVPIMVEGRLIGAIGVSGGMPDQDEQMANAAAAALAQAS
ncbi:MULTISPECIES: heme-binding protein [Mycobacteriaceae]|uniref:GlcG/HbpS family heme-binding protein n=1 Tax=Mycobacteriaceae TaxID=1762 RepID=UPI0009A6AD32|nr:MULTISPECIES: heme-binding protein [Mycobacteriaceae]QZH61216.1 heme-binding protein [Mycolicibacterium farcinogenes]SKQ87077.1 protein glcG [Mycobacteroides abscessus subsp. massiliense]